MERNKSSSHRNTCKSRLEDLYLEARMRRIAKEVRDQWLKLWGLGAEHPGIVAGAQSTRTERIIDKVRYW